jgi:hypothetical protein
LPIFWLRNVCIGKCKRSIEDDFFIDLFLCDGPSLQNTFRCWRSERCPVCHNYHLFKNYSAGIYTWHMFWRTCLETKLRMEIVDHVVYDRYYRKLLCLAKIIKFTKL